MFVLTRPDKFNLRSSVL